MQAPLRILDRVATDVRRDRDVGRGPQRMIGGERFRVRHVEAGASHGTTFEGGDEGGGVDDGTARDVADDGRRSVGDGGGRGEEREFGCGEEMGCLLAVLKRAYVSM